MNRIALLALAVAFTCSGPIAWAQDAAAPSQTDDSAAPDDDFTGAQLGAACAPPAGLDQNARTLAERTCTAFLRGLTQGLFLQGRVEDSGAAACMPRDAPVSMADARGDVLDYLARNPAAADREASVAAVLAIVRAFSCGAD